MSSSIRYYLSERFRLRFEDAGIEDMMDEESESMANAAIEYADGKAPDEKAVDMNVLSDSQIPAKDGQLNSGTIKTLDGELVSDDLEGDAINYQILLGKIDALLERMKLDA